MRPPWRGVRSRWLAKRTILARLQRAGVADVGRWTYGDPDVRTFDHDPTRLRIGNFTSIAYGTTIILGGEHPTEEITTFPLRIMMNLEGAGADRHPSTRGDVFIGHDVWIGARTTILSGARIGTGSVIGAGSVVTGDIPPYTIAAGLPARPIRRRLNDDHIEAMLKIAWWEWPDDVIKARVDDLNSHDTEAFIKKYGKY